jgi:serine protease inhibitor
MYKTMNRIAHERIVGFIATVLSTLCLSAQAATNSLQAGFNDVGFELLRRATAAKPGENALISPASLGFTLALLDQAASPQVEKELLSLLQVANLTKSQLAASSRLLRETFLKPITNSNFQLDVAQSVWVDRRVNIGAEFLRVAQNAFASETKLCDFSDRKTSADMNAWVATKTHGKITFVPTPDNSQGFPTVLLNAVYFHDTWIVPFPKHATHPDVFNGKANATKPMFMMQQELKTAYANHGGVEYVSLDYRDGAFVMDLILPRSAFALEKWIASAKSRGYGSAIAQLKPRLLDLKLPRFEFSTAKELTDDLAAMGLKSADQPGAFPGIAGETYLSDVMQKTYIRVDEEGTEAAAVTTAITMSLGIHEPPKTIKVVFDRPFFFAIRHRQTGALLFLGTIWNLPDAAINPNEATTR